jgi:hypothetical protein
MAGRHWSQVQALEWENTYEYTDIKQDGSLTMGGS